MRDLCTKRIFRGLAAAFLFPLAVTTANGQYNIPENNIWVFGYKSVLDFNSGSAVLSAPQELPGNSTGSAAVADSEGKLLFYTNGYNVWTKGGQVMPNGSTIFPVVGRLSPFSGNQGALIVPVLGQADQYYVFSQEATSNSANDNGVSRLWYSVVDMTLNNGEGDVVAGKKSILLDSALNGTMIAIPGKECNIWVLTHAIDGNVFKAYNVTASGIAAEPVTSTLGTLPPTAYKWGRMRISPDGKMLGLISTGNGGGITGAGVELYDFDAGSGTLSNVRFIDQIGGNGLAFSPDNSKLYVTGVVPVTYKYSLFQFDVTQPTATAITNSKELILNTQWTDLRLAPDGKIYHIINSTKLGVINSPNLSGAACNYTADVITSVSSVNQFGMYLPAEYIKGQPAETIYATALDTAVCATFASLTLTGIEGAKNYTWDDGSTGSSREITAPGTYYVHTQVDFCTNRVDTFVVNELDEVLAVINVKGFVLGTTTPFDRYQWLLNGKAINGATDSIYQVKENGNYSVVVTTDEGCRDTSDVYRVTNYEEPTSLQDINGIAASIKVYPNPSDDILNVSSAMPLRVVLTSLDGKVLLEADSKEPFGIQALARGIYFLRCLDMQGNLIKVEKIVKGRW